MPCLKSIKIIFVDNVHATGTSTTAQLILLEKYSCIVVVYNDNMVCIIYICVDDNKKSTALVRIGWIWDLK